MSRLYRLPIAFSLFAGIVFAAAHDPIPVPAQVFVKSSQPKADLFAALSEQEKNFAAAMIKAAQAGRTILLYQHHRHALDIKEFLDRAFSDRFLSATKALLSPEAFDELQRYAVVFAEKHGPYVFNRKYILTKVSPKDLATLFDLYASSLSKTARREISKLLTDKSYEVLQMTEVVNGDGLEKTGGNLYEKGITGKELRRALQAGLKTPLNCRVVKEAGKLSCSIQALNNPQLDPRIEKALQTIVKQLTKALAFAQTDLQRTQLTYLIKYLSEGDVEDFRQFNIAWVKDRANSKVDFMMGYVETYTDFRSQIGSWEGYVQIVDPEVTRMSAAIASKAQHFEDLMPYGQYKKVFPADYSPPALMVKILAEISPYRIAGYNLPNFDDIRRDVGAKNIIRLPLTGESEASKAMFEEFYKEFAPSDKLAGIMQHQEKAWQILVLLHEIIGHGSGTYNEALYPNNVDPVSVLGALGAALEEQRADLTGLVFVNDPALVSVGFYNNQAEAEEMRRVLYDLYLSDFMKRVIRFKVLSESHLRGNWLFINKALEAGAIMLVSHDGSALSDNNAVYRVVDYDAFQEVARNLLAELQDIKATCKKTELEVLFSTYSPLDAINRPLFKAMFDRSKDMAVSMVSTEQPMKLYNVRKVPVLETQGEATIEGIVGHLRLPKAAH